MWDRTLATSASAGMLSPGACATATCPRAAGPDRMDAFALAEHLAQEAVSCFD